MRQRCARLLSACVLPDSRCTAGGLTAIHHDCAEQASSGAASNLLKQHWGIEDDGVDALHAVTLTSATTAVTACQKPGACYGTLPHMLHL